MLSATCHSISGRIRLKIPKFKKFDHYAYQLETSIQSLEGVTQVNLDSHSSSVIVYYDSKLLTDSQIQDKLGDILEKISKEQSFHSGVIAFDGYKSVNLTPYESEQLLEIYQWRKKQPAFLTNLTGQLFSPFKKVADFVCPDDMITNLVKDIEASSGDWEKHWQHLKHEAEVEDYRQLKQVPLEKCDHLVHKVEDKALNKASFDGGITGLFEWMGEIADVGLTLSLAVTTIHKIGLCYGYNPVTPTERQFSWAILKVATALTPRERQDSVDLLHQFQNTLYQDSKRVVEDVVEESTVGTLEDGAVEEMITGIVEQIFDNEIGQSIPVVGVGLGIIADRKMIEEVNLAAQREFQLRWLLENEKVIFSS